MLEYTALGRPVADGSGKFEQRLGRSLERDLGALLLGEYRLNLEPVFQGFVAALMNDASGSADILVVETRDVLLQKIHEATVRLQHRQQQERPLLPAELDTSGLPRILPLSTSGSEGGGELGLFCSLVVGLLRRAGRQVGSWLCKLGLGFVGGLHPSRKPTVQEQLEEDHPGHPQACSKANHIVLHEAGP